MKFGRFEFGILQDILLKMLGGSNVLNAAIDDFLIAELFYWKAFMSSEYCCHPNANAPFAQCAHFIGVFAMPFVFTVGVPVVVIVIRGFVDSVVEFGRYEIERPILGYDAGIVDSPRLVSDLPNRLVHLKSRYWIGGVGVVELN